MRCSLTKLYIVISTLLTLPLLAGPNGIPAKDSNIPIYMATGEGAPLHYAKRYYHNEEWGITLNLPPRYYGAEIISQFPFSIMLRPIERVRARDFRRGETLSIQISDIRKAKIPTLKYICDYNRNLLMKSRQPFDKLLINEYNKEYCYLKAEKISESPNYRVVLYLIRNGSRILEISMQYPTNLENLYSSYLKQMLDSLRWDPWPDDQKNESKNHYAPVQKIVTAPQAVPRNTNVTQRMHPKASQSHYHGGSPSRWALGYDNPTIGIHLRFPKKLFLERPIRQEPDGIFFTTGDRQGLLYIAWARTRLTIEQLFLATEQRLGNTPHVRVTYAKRFGNQFAIIAVNTVTGKISYLNGYVDGERFYLYMLNYPYAQKSYYNGVIRAFNEQFHPPMTPSVTSMASQSLNSSARKKPDASRCDAMARACYAGCPDDDNHCLDRCVARRDQCYQSGRW